MPVHHRPLEPNSTADGSFRASADHCRQLGCVPGDGGHVEEASFLTVFLQVCQYTQPLLVRSWKFSTEYQAGYGRSSDAKRLKIRRDFKRATCPANRFVRSKHPAAVFSCLARIRLRYVPVRGLAVSTTLTPYLNQSVHRPSRPTPRQSQGRVYEDEEANHWQPVVTYCNRRNLHVAGLYSIWPFSVALIIPSS